MKPVIVHSELTHRWYVATRYKYLEGDKMIASIKYDVTDQMLKIINEACDKERQRLEEERLNEE